MVDEVGQLPAVVHRLAGGTHALCQSRGSTAEHANLTHVRMVLLYKFEERSHVWSTKVVDGLQTSEHTAIRNPLKVVFADVLEIRKKKLLDDEFNSNYVHVA